MTLSQSLRLRISKTGEILGQISHNTPSFHLSTEIIELLRIVTQEKNSTHYEKLEKKLKKWRDNLELPDKKEISELIHSLTEEGFILPETASTLGENEFGDPWIQWAMLSDSKRIEQYEKAIKESLSIEDSIIDVGAGTGILGALAIKHGAKKAYLVEEASINQLIPKLYHSLGINKKQYQIFPTNTENISYPNDIKLLVSELFGNDPLQEGLIPTLRYLASELPSNLKCIPIRLEIFGEFVSIKPSSKLFNRLNTFQTPEKPFLKSFKNFCTDEISFPAGLVAEDFEKVSSALELEKIPLTLNKIKNFRSISNKQEITIKNLPDAKNITKTFENTHFMIWFRAFLTENTTISSHPKQIDFCEHWSPLIVVLREPIYKKDNIEVRFYTENDETKTCINILKNGRLVGKRGE